MTQLQNVILTRLALVLGGLSVPSLEREDGQTLVEYALILVTIAVAVTVAMLFLRDQIISVFTQIGSAV